MKSTARYLGIALLFGLFLLHPSVSEGMGVQTEGVRAIGLFTAGGGGISAFEAPSKTAARFSVFSATGASHRPTLFSEKEESGKSSVGGRHKSPGVAVVLSILLPGAGQWYNGQVGKGFGFFGLEMVGWGVWVWAVVSAVDNVINTNTLTVSKKSMGKAYAGLGIMMVATVWSCVDAFKTAKKINDGRALYQNEKTGRSLNVTVAPMVKPTGELGGQLALRATF